MKKNLLIHTMKHENIFKNSHCLRCVLAIANLTMCSMDGGKSFISSEVLDANLHKTQ